MSKHTPGPWLIVTDRDDRWLRTGLQVAGEPCHILINDDMSSDPLADARLIAAAPDLLAALEMSIERMCQLYESDCEMSIKAKGE